MGTSTDHTGCEQMVEQPRDMRSGKGCSFLSRPRTTHETAAAGGANYRLSQGDPYYLLPTLHNMVGRENARECIRRYQRETPLDTLIDIGS